LLGGTNHPKREEQPSSVTFSEPIQTPGEAIQTPSEAIRTPSEAIQTLSEAIQTLSEAIPTQSEAIHAPGEAIQVPGQRWRDLTAYVRTVALSRIASPIQAPSRSMPLGLSKNSRQPCALALNMFSSVCHPLTTTT